MTDEKPVLPDETAIRRDLEYITERWGELDRPAVFEVRAFKPDCQTQIARFSPDWIDDAVDFITNLNERGYNVYSTRNPIDQNVSTKGAKDTDVIAAFFLWADCDDAPSANNMYRFDGPKWSAAVTTGRTPSIRVHTYWALKEPCHDLAEWRQMQETIAAHFRSDKSVINPSRIMRVGGTVSYPSDQKIKRGYIKEVTEIRTEYDEAREPVTLDQMRRVFGDQLTSNSLSTSNQLTIDIGPQPLDRERTAIQAMSGQEWNNAVLRLVGSYVRKGLSDGEIHALTDPLTLAGYTVEDTRAEVQDMIDRTRRNPAFNEPESYTPNFDHAPAPTTSDPQPQTAGWQIQSAADFTADFVAPEYLIDGVVQRGRLYTLTAPTGAGKTAVMLYASTAIATGGQFCGLDVEAGDVLFLAGENPDDVRARVIATLDFYGIDPRACRLHFIAGTFSIRADLDRLAQAAEALPNVTLIVVDTFAAYFDGEDENNNAQALDFARVVRGLTQIKSKPAVIMPAHPVKNATRGNLSPKGGSSLVNEVDGNLTIWNDDGLVTLHWQTKHRGPDFDPLKLELERKECDKLADKNGRVIPTILAKPVLDLRATQIVRDNLALEDQLLINLHDAPDLSIAERCRALAVTDTNGNPYKSKLQRVLLKMAEQRLIKRFRTRWELTADGKRAVDEIIEGKVIPVETDE